MRNFSISKIEDVNFTLDSKLKDQSLNGNDLNISFENNTKFSCNSAIFELTVKYIYKPNRVLLLQTIEIEFSGDFAEFAKGGDSDELNDIIFQFQSIGIGAMRGIIAIKTKNSSLKNFPLPLVGSAFLKQRIEDSINEKKSQRNG